MSTSTQNTTTDVTEKWHRSQMFSNFCWIQHSLHNHRNQILGESMTPNLWQSYNINVVYTVTEALNDLYSSPNIVRVIKSRKMRWAGHVVCMGEERGVYRVLVGKPEGRRPLGRPRHRWVDNIRTDLQEVGCGYIDWIGLAQDRDRWQTLVSAVMNLRVPWNAGNFWTSCKPVSFSRTTLHHGVSIYCYHTLYLCTHIPIYIKG